MDQYEKVKKIGEGSYGVVYKARDLIANKTIALNDRLQDVVHSENRFYIAFEYLDLDLKKNMDSCPDFAKDPRLVKVSDITLLSGYPPKKRKRKEEEKKRANFVLRSFMYFLLEDLRYFINRLGI
ncbi:hypothetical protein Patl1_27009 [Pistacia atlantica]|uniref:Uncharacterized protein n=1 Tax=Pistacia atlantica TaxID=434234 RepID=A0ACC1B0D0_9ROSI|nr:hypothetical protein Patl1_27009 [Pistacia atlantica]